MSNVTLNEYLAALIAENADEMAEVMVGNVEFRHGIPGISPTQDTPTDTPTPTEASPSRGYFITRFGLLRHQPLVKK